MKEKFKEISEKNPNLSSLLVFGRLLKMTPKEGWNGWKVSRWFTSLVDKEDYAKNEKGRILEHLKNPYFIRG